jgi:CHAD domain-containing protein
MAYRLALAEDLAGSLQGVARDQLEGAADGLGSGDDLEEAVHDARKRIKKTRAALRLARPGLSKRVYRAENAALRDTARGLSGARDADVMVETAEKLGERYAGHAPATLFEQLRDRLAARRGGAGADAGEAADTLRALAAGVDAWAIAGDERDVLVPALHRTYARGREAFAVADRRPTAEHLHEWRKRVKDLWYQEKLVSEAWPEVLEAHADEAKALSKLLGDDHDLAVLSELLGAEPGLTDDPDLIHELIGRRRNELLEAVRALGRRVYAERPKAYARRLERYLTAPHATAPLAG